MKIKCCYYALFDKNLRDFGPVFGCKNDSVAVIQAKRLFDDLIKKDQYFDPKSYVLFHMFDMEYCDDEDIEVNVMVYPDFSITKVNHEILFEYNDPRNNKKVVKDNE